MTMLTRRELREKELEDALQKLHERHREERRALSQELLKLDVGRKAIQEQVWADWINRARQNLTPEQQAELSAELPRTDRCVHVVKHHLDRVKEQALDSRLATLVEQGEDEAALKLKYLNKLSREENRRSSQQEDGVSSAAASSSSASAAASALNGKEGLGEGDEEIPYCVEIVLKASQERDKEKQALLKELLPAKSELHVEVQRLLEVLEEKVLRQAYDHRICIEDPRELKARYQTLAATRAGLWRFVSKKRVQAEREFVERGRTAEDDIAYVNVQRLGYPELPSWYEETKNLLDIEENPIFSKVLGDLIRKQELLDRRVERYEIRVANLKNELYQLIGFFSVFQGVVLTAVSQSSLLYCHNKWSPISLSVLASVITSFGVLQKAFQINAFQTNIDKEKGAINLAVKFEQQLRALGPKEFVSPKLVEEKDNNQKTNLSLKTLPYWVFVVVFGVLFPFSFWRILCKPGFPAAP